MDPQAHLASADQNSEYKFTDRYNWITIMENKSGQSIPSSETPKDKLHQSEKQHRSRIFTDFN